MPGADPPRRYPPALRVLLVLGSSTGGVGRHVASLVTGCREAGISVAVAGPAATEEEFGFTALGAVFFAVEIGSAPRPDRDARAVRALASAAGDWRASVLHAHGLRAGAVAVLAGRGAAAARAGGAALARLRGRGAPARPSRPLVVTWHNAVDAEGARGRLLDALETLVARGADLTLGASPDLVDRARSRGAREAQLGVVAAARLPEPARDWVTVRADLGAEGRPLLLAVGRLAPQKDYPTMLTASRAWLGLDPTPLLAIAGAGPLREELAARIDEEKLPVRLLGARDDVADLLAAADAVVLSSTWEARALIAQEALRAGVPLVATAVGGVPDLVGDAAVLVPPGDPDALAAAVTALLADPGLSGRLAAAGPVRAATWPDEAAVRAELLDLYARLSRRAGDAAAPGQG